MKLFANGCSWTFGGGLYSTFEEDGSWNFIQHPGSTHPKNIEREQVVWPGQLGQLMGADKVVNLAIGAGSNARIVRTTLDYFYEQLSLGADLSDYVAVIQWTDISRHEYHAHGKWWLANANGVGFDTGYKSGTLPHDMFLPKQQLAHGNYYYKHIHSVEQDVYNTVAQVSALGGFFEKHNIPYVFWSMNGIFLYNNDLGEKQYLLGINEFNWLFDTVDDSRFTCFVSVEPEYYIPNDGHPNEKGHRMTAERIHDRLKFLGKIK